MRNINWQTVILCALTCLVIVMARDEGARAFGGASTDSNGDMIAVTGEYGNGTSVLYVIDTKSKHMAVYRSMNGNGVQMVAARRIEHDLKLLSYRDNTAQGYEPLALERQYRKYNERKEAGEPAPEAPEKKADEAEKK